MEKIVNRLIEENSKKWLAEELGIERATLYTRLKTNKWKKLEISKIISLSKRNELVK